MKRGKDRRGWTAEGGRGRNRQKERRGGIEGEKGRRNVDPRSFLKVGAYDEKRVLTAKRDKQR